MDGTPRGADAAARFEELSKLVTAIIGQHHHELAVRLHDTYRSFDPSEQRRQNKADRPTADSALAFSAALHAVLRSAGFQLCSREDEAIAVEGHFGDEAVWNVPVAIDWAAMDESLVRRERGGFDAWSTEAAAGRAVSRPEWADRLVIYHRGTGMLEKKGYYIVPKLEEMITRRAQALAARLYTPFARRAADAREWAARHVHALERGGARLGLISTSEPPERKSESSDDDALASSASAADHAVHADGAGAGGHEPCRAATLQSVNITLRSLFEETTLTTSTMRHVLLAFRHRDAYVEANSNPMHVALALYRNVPATDLDMLLPHTKVRMPGFQRAQFGAMGVAGLVAAYPLLHEGALSLTGLLTLYTVAALGSRTAFRWRAAKQLYQEQLRSYQHSNRVGSSDGALLCVARLAEEEQIRQALLLLHALLRAQLAAAVPSEAEDGRTTTARDVDSSRSACALIAESRRVMRSWSQLEGMEIHFDDDARVGPLPLLVSMGVAERVEPPGRRALRDHGEMHVRLRPLEEALAAAHDVWQKLGKRLAPSSVGADCMRELHLVAQDAQDGDGQASQASTSHST